MAFVQRVVVVPIADAEAGIPPQYRPFAVVEDDVMGPCVVCSFLDETVGEKDSRVEGNQPAWEAS